jgi:ATP-dependent helicase HrpA
LLKLAKISERGMVRDLQRHAARDAEAQRILLSAGVEREPLLDTIVSLAILPNLESKRGLIRTKDEFVKALSHERRTIIERAVRLEKLILQALRSFGEARVALSRLPAYAELSSSVADAKAHWERLTTMPAWLHWSESMVEQLPRYAKALAWRVDRLQSQLPKDQNSVALLQPIEHLWLDLLEKRASLSVVCEPLRAYHWMVEEFRVSLFAQQLGTKMPVSEKRLTEQWNKVLAWTVDNPL